MIRVWDDCSVGWLRLLCVVEVMVKAALVLADCGYCMAVLLVGSSVRSIRWWQW